MTPQKELENAQEQELRSERGEERGTRTRDTERVPSANALWRPGHLATFPALLRCTYIGSRSSEAKNKERYVYSKVSYMYTNAISVVKRACNQCKGSTIAIS